MPKLNQIKERHPDLSVLAITPDSSEKVIDYVARFGLNWPVAANASEMLFERLNVKVFPGFALLDSNGRLLATVYANQFGGTDGHATTEGIEAWVNFHRVKAAN